MTACGRPVALISCLVVVIVFFSRCCKAAPPDLPLKTTSLSTSRRPCHRTAACGRPTAVCGGCIRRVWGCSASRRPADPPAPSVPLTPCSSHSFDRLHPPVLLRSPSPPGVAPTRMAARDWIYAPALFACCCARTLLFAVCLLYHSVPFFSLGVGFSVELGGEGGLYNPICLLFAARGLTVHLTSVESSASPFLTFRGVCWLPVVGLWLHLLWVVLVGCGACLPPCCLCLLRQRFPAASSLASVSLSLSVACVLPPVPLSTLVLSTFCPSVCRCGL